MDVIDKVEECDIHESFEKSLMEKYPDLFYRDIEGKIIPPSCGISVPIGWHELVDALCKSITNYTQHTTRSRKTNKILPRLHMAAYKLGSPLYNRLYTLIDPLRKYKPPGAHYWSMPAAKADEIRARHPYRSALISKLQKSWRSPTNYYESYKPQPTKIAQIKQKFGELRVYTDGGDDRVEGMISFAEHLSQTICEDTGEPGALCIKGGWYRVLSEKVMKEHGYHIV